MSECMDCGTRLSDTTNSAYCDACVSSHMVLAGMDKVDHSGCEYLVSPLEWKYCPHCGERLG